MLNKILSLLNIIISIQVIQSRNLLYGCGYGSTVTNSLISKHLLDLTVAMGATSTGAGTCQCSWIDIQKNETAPYDFSGCDSVIFTNYNRSLECFAYTGFTPAWALNQSIINKYGPGIGYRFPPDPQYIPQFEAAYTAIAKRYDGIVKYWSFGNEQNGCGWESDGCANSKSYDTYTPWLIRWYKAMKQGSNNTVLAMGGLDYNIGSSYNNASEYIVGVINNGGSNFFDAVPIHPYAASEINWLGLNDTINVLNCYYGKNKKIWVNEYGWNIDNDDLKSKYLMEVLTVLKTNAIYTEYVIQSAYLQIQDLPNSNWGIVDVDYTTNSITPRNSWYSFQEFDKS
eukprot:332351_1